jgi:hypothetical protein
MSSIYSFMHILRAKKRFILLIGSIALAAALSIGTTSVSLHVAKAVACDNPRALEVGRTLEQSESWRTVNAEWIDFKVQKNSRYLLQVKNDKGLELAVYDRCDASAPAIALRDGQLEFTATRDGVYYLLVKQDAVFTASSTGYQASLSPAAPYPPSAIAAEDVPADVLRRATEFLEELRGSDLAPEWIDARIKPEARILYRPDVGDTTPAYYEVTVEKPVVGGAYEPAGYIQLSSGEHDYLIVSWNMSGQSVTEELAELAPLGATITKIYRLDPLSYAAEYEQLTSIGISTVMTDVVNLGDLPFKTTGLENLPDEAYDLVTESTDSAGETTYDGPAPLDTTETAWESWAALKAGYTDEYAQLNRSLKQRASDEWTLEANIKQYGETLIKNDVRTIYGLATQTLSSIQVTGEGAGAQYLGQEQLKDNNTLTGIILTVLDEPTDQKTLLPINVALQYTSGVTETLKYAIANHNALTNFYKTVYLPVLSGNASPGSAFASVAAPTAALWGPWHYYWVDSSGDALAMRYDQIPPGWDGNTRSCYSGCAGTGWAMLFGWVDRRASEGHWRWWNQWGLVRANAAVAPAANIVAPLTQTLWDSNDVVNKMSLGLRDALHTSCSGNQGSTSRPDEIRAADWVRPRASAGWHMQTAYDPTGLCWFGACDGARSLIVNQIVNRQAPAIIGANSHIQLGVGYAWQSETSCFLWWCSTSYNRWFYINKGWGGAGNGWLDYDDVYLGGVFYP